MLIIGLTGGIGCGKSAVSEMFSDLGVPVLDADQVARDVVEPKSSALEEIRKRFGNQIIDHQGQLDRTQLREVVFSDPQAKADLEQILHPKIRQRMRQWVEQQTAPYVILVIPLLFETGQHKQMNRVLVVDAPESLQIERVCTRDNSSVESAQAIINSQISRQQRLKLADDVIENTGTLDHLRKQVTALHKKYLELSTAVTG